MIFAFLTKATFIKPSIDFLYDTRGYKRASSCSCSYTKEDHIKLEAYGKIYPLHILPVQRIYELLRFIQQNLEKKECNTACHQPYRVSLSIKFY